MTAYHYREPAAERDEVGRSRAALAGETGRKGWPRHSGNRGPAGWIADPQSHEARGNHRPTPELRLALQSEPSWVCAGPRRSPEDEVEDVGQRPPRVPTLPSIKGVPFHSALAPTLRSLGSDLLKSSAHVCVCGRGGRQCTCMGLWGLKGVG